MIKSSCQWIVSLLMDYLTDRFSSCAPALFISHILQCLKEKRKSLLLNHSSILSSFMTLFSVMKVSSHFSTKWVESGRHRAHTGHDCHTVSTTRFRFGLLWRAASCVGSSQIYPCLKRACLGQDWLWLYFGESEQSGWLDTVARLQWRAGCSRSPERGQSSAGTASSSKLTIAWTEPASWPWEKSDLLTTHTLKVSLKDRNTSLFYDS